MRLKPLHLVKFNSNAIDGFEWIELPEVGPVPLLRRANVAPGVEKAVESSPNAGPGLRVREASGRGCTRSGPAQVTGCMLERLVELRSQLLSDKECACWGEWTARSSLGVSGCTGLLGRSPARLEFLFQCPGAIAWSCSQGRATGGTRLRNLFGTQHL